MYLHSFEISLKASNRVLILIFAIESAHSAIPHIMINIGDLKYTAYLFR
jgi:hypothetical protein